MTLHVEWGIAAMPLPGQAECGDMGLVKNFAGGVLAVAVDGIGHGQEAASAARTALAAIEPLVQEPVIPLVMHCHEALRGTRGVVMGLASFVASHDLLTWIGIGNVTGVILRADSGPGKQEAMLMRAGVVGSQLPPLQAAVIPVSAGDTLVFATDGVRSDFTARTLAAASPQKAAELFLAENAKGTDDGLAVVVRFLGSRG